jgi:AcrR family transcriptional regulator
VAGTSVASITTAAGLAKRVFYDHFADKEACFVELFREFGAERLRAALNTAEAASDPSAFGSSAPSFGRSSPTGHPIRA